MYTFSAGYEWIEVGLGDVEVLTIWGRTRHGRPLIVALRRKSEWDWWIVGVRELRPRELIELETWEARHD
jgi:hypothetical protein